MAAETPIDTTDPVITIIGDDPLTIQAGSTYEDAGRHLHRRDRHRPDCHHRRHGRHLQPPAPTRSPTPCTDSSGNNATADRIVFVRAADTVDDTKAPEIDITGESFVRLHVGDTYVEMGARCVDDTDGDVGG